MTAQAFKNINPRPRIELKEFLVVFLTVAILFILSLERFSIAEERVNKRKAEKTVLTIIHLEKAFGKEHGRFGSLSEIGFVSPFSNNVVEFSVSIDQSGFFVQATENPLIDAFGDKIPGNEYFVGYSNGSIEYNKKH